VLPADPAALLPDVDAPDPALDALVAPPPVGLVSSRELWLHAVTSDTSRSDTNRVTGVMRALIVSILRRGERGARAGYRCGV
jgi:hypothetical protein